MASNGAQGARQIWVSEQIHAAIALQAHKNHRKMRMESEVVLCEALQFEDLDALNAKFTDEYIQELKDRGVIKTGRGAEK